MISRTKPTPTADALARILARAGFTDIAAVTPLGAGEYNAVFTVRHAGGEAVLKIAPDPALPVLAYERGMMAAELFWMGKMREAGITVPVVLASDLSRAVVPSDWFAMSRLPGRQLDEMAFTEAESVAAFAATARMVAAIHRVTNDRCGYVQRGLFPDWHQAIRAMVADLLADAARVHRTSRRGERLLAAIDRHQDVLRAAERTMVNFDVWPPNILCDRDPTGIVTYGWIDPERTFWGDPVADLVSLELFTPLAEKTRTLAAYNAVASVPIVPTPATLLRFAVAQGYLALLMEVEKYYRYTPLHFGWSRNAFVSGWLYRAALPVLERP